MKHKSSTQNDDSHRLHVLWKENKTPFACEEISICVNMFNEESIKKPTSFYPSAYMASLIFPELTMLTPTQTLLLLFHTDSVQK